MRICMRVYGVPTVFFACLGIGRTAVAVLNDEFTRIIFFLPLTSPIFVVSA